MPLHLLGKKSWNVYNQDIVERVRRDEERARADEQEKERAKRANDADERLRLLRGDDAVAELAIKPDTSVKRKRESEHVPDHDDRVSQDKRKSDRRDRDVEDRRTSFSRRENSGDPLDHISNMRFRDAAGRNPDARKPWYSALSTDPDSTPNHLLKDAWGNEDAGRQARDQKRLIGNDPLLAMKRGVKQLRQVEKQKAEWREERERDLSEVEQLARRERHRRRKEEKRHVHDRDRTQGRHRHGNRHNSSRSRHRDRERSPRG